MGSPNITAVKAAINELYGSTAGSSGISKRALLAQKREVPGTFSNVAAYGTPEDLKELVNKAHQLGLAIIIDLVYNHLGPDGNYLSCYNPHYFTDKHSTPWGAALNYDLSTKVDKDSKESPEEQNKDVKHAPFVRAFVVSLGSSLLCYSIVRLRYFRRRSFG